MVKKNTNILTISLFIIELKNYIVSKTARKQTKNMLFSLDKEPDLALISPKNRENRANKPCFLFKSSYFHLAYSLYPEYYQ